jgi:SAM-dependent methyltransferase
MKQWYESLFENYAAKYDQETFVRGTIGECDFIESEIEHNKSLKILDIGCGTGRHAIELSKRGYTVTGIDLSESQLTRAKEKAQNDQLNIDFLKLDARKLPFEDEFDLVIMLCEGAFPLMETDEMNYDILRNAAYALKKPGKFIFTTLNGLFPLYNSPEEFCNESSLQDGAKYLKSDFDLMTFRDRDTMLIEDDNGNKKEIKCNERYYVPPEITWLLKTLHFHNIDIFAANLGAFSREDKLTVNDFEMLVVADY